MPAVEQPLPYHGLVDSAASPITARPVTTGRPSIAPRPVTKFEGVKVHGQAGQTSRQDGENAEFGIAFGHKFGEKLNLSRERIRQIEKKAKKKLERAAKGRKLMDFLN